MIDKGTIKGIKAAIDVIPGSDSKIEFLLGVLESEKILREILNSNEYYQNREMKIKKFTLRDNGL